MESTWLSRAMRTNIVDFHVPGQMKIGAGFDAESFGEKLATMGSQAVALFNKCHYGWNYYDTGVGPKHPGLNFDLFKQQLDACVKRDVTVMAYYSLARDSAAWDTHPNWRMVNSKGEPIRTARGDWGVVCFNGPYVEELVWPQVREIITKYPEIKGFWWDIVGFPDDSCYCQYCLEQMAAEGVDPRNHRAHYAFNERSVVRFLEQARMIVDSLRPDLRFTVNGTGRVGPARRCRIYTDLLVTEYVPFRQGFLYWVPYAHHMRTLDRPFNATMSRFHKGWGDLGSMKTDVQLQYEVAHAMSAGGTCQFVDQPGPDVNLWPTVVEQMRKAYSFVKDREGWCTDARAVTNVAVLADPLTGERKDDRAWNAVQGACKALKEGHFLFDVIDRDGDFERYKVIIMADNQELTPAAIERLREYVRKGGNVLATYWASLRPATPAEPPGFALEDVFGVGYKGLTTYARHYLELRDKAVLGDLPDQPWMIYDRALQVKPKDGAEVLATLRYPMFDVIEGMSYSHSQSPPSHHQPAWPAALVRNKYGAGTSVYFSVPILRAFWENNTPQYRTIIANILDLLLGGDRIVEVDAGPSVDVSLMAQGNRLVLHLINYHAERRAILPIAFDRDDPLNRWAITPYPQPPKSYDRLPSHEVIEEIPPRHNVAVRVKLPSKPAKAYFAPSMNELAYQQDGDTFSFTVPELKVHEMAVFEYSKPFQTPYR